MAGTHNFKVFDETLANMTPDASYNSDTSRLGGAQPNSVADPLSANKAWHQATIMAAAIAQYVANQGASIDDTNLSNLVTALAGSIASLSGISYADRAAHGLFGAADIGQISYCPAQPTPAAATYTASGTGNLNGSYHYREVLISGYKNPDGTYFVRGFSPAASRGAADVSPSSQQVVITNLPIGAAGCIGRAIYRSVAGGAAGTEQFCGIIWDNTVTTYTDNLVDSQLGTGMPVVQRTAIPVAVPTSNTTGTALLSCTKSGTVYTIQGFSVSTGISPLSFRCPVAYAAGDTVTINGTAYTLKTRDNSALTKGAWAAGAIITGTVDVDAKTLTVPPSAPNGSITNLPMLTGVSPDSCPADGTVYHLFNATGTSLPPGYTSGDNDFYLYVNSTSAPDWVRQLLIDCRTAAIWTRVKNSGTWWAWVNIADGGTAANTTSISGALTLVSGGTAPSSTLAAGKLWAGY